MFTSTSRYQGVPVAELSEGGRVVRYARRRFLPQPGRAPAIAEHLIEEGDRLDRVSARYLGAPELYFRICDENGTLHPDELDPRRALGRRIRIPAPYGG
jgi:hypothetical protein